MLANHDIGKQAVTNHDLLKEVVKIKKTFYDSSYANYDACLTGDFHLIPNEAYLKLLKADFDMMLRNKMFYGEQPDFEKIINEIARLEIQINNQ